jgi:DNA-binding NtrC family response regulator
MRAEEQPKTILLLCATRLVPGIEKEMKSRGVRVQRASTITAATALLDSAPDGTIVITELVLRDGNWRDLLERLRCFRKPTRIALVSPTRTSELWWDALDCGVEDILLAPLSVSRICEYLNLPPS